MFTEVVKGVKKRLSNVSNGLVYEVDLNVVKTNKPNQDVHDVVLDTLLEVCRDEKNQINQIGIKCDIRDVHEIDHELNKRLEDIDFEKEDILNRRGSLVEKTEAYFILASGLAGATAAYKGADSLAHYLTSGIIDDFYRLMVAPIELLGVGTASVIGGISAAAISLFGLQRFVHTPHIRRNSTIIGDERIYRNIKDRLMFFTQ